MKKLLVILLSTLMVVSLFGCKKDNKEETTMGSVLAKDFLEIVKTENTCEAIANKLIENEVIEYGCGTMEVEPGWLNGFSADVTKFENGWTFGPYIGSVPFIGYVFSTNDVAGLKAELEANHDLRWNVCTAADYYVIETSGNFVFFTMCPNAVEE